MSTEQFREAFRKSWDREIPPDEARQRLRAIQAAFELEDLQALARDRVLVESDLSLSKDLVERIENDSLGYRAADWAGWFGDNLVNPGTIFMIFAPMSKFSMTAKWMARGGEAAKELSAVRTVAETFQSSRAYTWAVQKLAGTKLGTALLETSAAASRFADRGKLQAASVFVTEVTAQMGASFTIGHTLGPEAQYLFDMFVSFGGADTRTLGRTFQRLGQQGSHLKQIAARTRGAAGRVLREVEDAGRISRALREAVDEGASPEALRAVGRELDAIPELPPEFRSQLETAIRQAETGAGGAAVRQSLDDLDNLRMARVDQARNAQQLAREFEDLAEALPETPPRNPGRERTRVPTEEPGAASASQGVPDRPPSPDARYNPNDLNSLARRGDRRMMQGRFEEAADAYEALLAQGRLGQTTESVIRAKRDIARRAARLKARIDTPAEEFVEEFTDALEQQVKEALEAGRYERPGVRSTASSPRAIFDEKGNPIAYFKGTDLYPAGGAATGIPPIRQGQAEVLASNLRHAAGRPGPAARVIDGVEIDGVLQKIVAIKAFPAGKELDELLVQLAKHPRIGGADWIVPTVLAQKEEIAEDIVYAMVLGDGDRHFGNLWFGKNRGAIGFDYGLADFLPDHAWYRNNPFRDSLVQSARNNLDDLVRRAEQVTGMTEDALMRAANPSDEVRAWQERLLKAREVFEEKVKAIDSGATSLYRVPDQPVAPDFRADPEGFTEYARKLMERHWTHGTRNWSSATGDYLETVIRLEDVAPHIRKLRELKEAGKVGDLVRRSLRDATEEEVEFATRMLEARIDALEEFFQGKFRSVPDSAFLRRVPRRVGPPRLPDRIEESHSWRRAA
jgi:hypothetical protein